MGLGRSIFTLDADLGADPRHLLVTVPQPLTQDALGRCGQALPSSQAKQELTPSALTLPIPCLPQIAFMIPPGGKGGQSHLFGARLLGGTDNRGLHCLWG